MVKTKEQYWKEVKDILGNDYNKFDFSNADFMGVVKPIRYFCKIHAKWVEKKEAREVLNNSYGCGTCVTEKRKKTKIEKSRKMFFEEAPKIHNNYYNYDNVVFVDMTTYVTITCPKHGDFPQKPIKHINAKQGCNQCGDERAHDKQRMTIDEFIRLSIEKHGNEHYNYDLVNYINYDTSVEIFCNICNKSFQQTPSGHLSGSGCTDCGIIKRATIRKDNSSKNFWKATFNDDRFDFSEYIYKTAREKSNLICKKCNLLFLTSPNYYLRGTGCPFCRNKTEKKLYESLKPLFPSLKSQLRVDWCRNQEECNGKRHYFPYDFYIYIEDGDLKLHIIIELDGIQHIKPVEHFDRKITFEERHKRDIYKEKCAKDNGYHTIRILQEDVWYDNNDWLNNIVNEIEYIKNNKEIVHHRYICDNNEYDIF